MAKAAAETSAKSSSSKTSSKASAGASAGKPTKVRVPAGATPFAGHGASELPSVTVDSYNLELRDKDGFIGDRASKRAFAEILEDARMRLRKLDADPIGKTDTADLSKKQLDRLLTGADAEAAALIHGSIEEFAQEFAGVIRRFLRTKGWEDTERIVAGGGFKDSRVGELAIARAAVMLKADGVAIEICPIRHHPDEAGLIGAAHLMPAWTLRGHDGLLAVDIGGTNIRAGIVRLNLKKASDLSEAMVWKSDLWRHADDSPKRTAAVERLTAMLQKLIDHADKERLTLAPVIGVGCPGIIEADGSIARGGQNLPGGNWESEHFSLPAALASAIPTIGDTETVVLIHNDAVVQGLSEVPFMQDVRRWGVVTIGTGLGNARFTNRAEPNARGESKSA